MRLLEASILSVFFFCSAVFASVEQQQSIIFSIVAGNQMGPISGPSPTFILPGSGCHSSTCTNTYAVSTNEMNKKITGSLDANMPSGVTLQVNLSPPDGARSMGIQTLSVTPVDLVIEISMVSEVGLPMVYTFSIEGPMASVTTSSRVVTYTITDG